MSSPYDIVECPHNFGPSPIGLICLHCGEEQPCPLGQPHIYVYNTYNPTCKVCGYEYTLHFRPHQSNIESDIRSQIDELDHEMSPDEIDRLVMFHVNRNLDRGERECDSLGPLPCYA